MDLNIYVDAIMQKLIDAKFYSEVEEYDLRKTISKYLTDEYNEKVELLQLQVDMENMKGSIKDVEYYRTKLTEIKSHIISLTRELGKTHKD